MTLTPNPTLGGWTGHAVFRGKPVQLTIDADMWEVDPQDAAHSALNAIDRRWSEIDQALVGKPLRLYNESWADPSKGFSKLAAEQFLEKLSLASVCLGQSSVTLYFADGDLFAGHTVSVTLVGDREPITMIEG